MEYRFNNAIFTPDAVTKLTVGGEVKHIAPREVKLLRYFLHHNDQIKHKNEILDAVWGPGQYSHHSVTSSISRLHSDIKPATNIQTLKHQGHILSVDLVIAISEDEKNTVDWEALCSEKTQVIFEAPKETRAQLIYVAPEDAKTEMALVEPEAEITEVEPEPKKKIKPQPLLLLFLFITGLSAYAGLTNWISPAPALRVKETKSIFMFDHFTGRPQLSPDGQYVLTSLANKLLQDGFLGLTDITTGNTTKLVKKGFNDGFKWDWSGNRIVYQRRADNSCQIRLLQLNADKTIADDRLLTTCLVKSGHLSFAWFNEHEFYVNWVDSERPGLPLHQLYSVDIHSKQVTEVLITKNEGGVGFHSLEYDPSTESLYLLKTKDFISTDFYRYRDGVLTKLTSLEHLVRQYTVVDHQLIYKSANNEWLINPVADDFSTSQLLIPSSLLPIAEPHFNGKTLTYMAGNIFGNSWYQWDDNQLSPVALRGFNPTVITNYKDTKIFVSNQKGTYQIYQLSDDQQVKQISDLRQNYRIKAITVAGDIVAVSFYRKVHFYRYQQGQLVLLHAVKGYSNAFLAPDGQRALLSTPTDTQPTGALFEMQLTDWQPKPLGIHNAVAAMYYQNEIIYIDDKQRLQRYGDHDLQLLAENIAIGAFEQSQLQGNQLYYIDSEAKAIQIYDLSHGEQTALPLKDHTPTRIAVMQNEIYIQIRQTLPRKLMVGQLSRK